MFLCHFYFFNIFIIKKNIFCSLCRINHDTYKFAISSCDVTLRRCFRFWVFPCNHIYLTQLLCTAIITCCKSHDKAALKYSLILYLQITHPKSNMFLCFLQMWCVNWALLSAIEANPAIYQIWCVQQQLSTDSGLCLFIFIVPAVPANVGRRHNALGTDQSHIH